MKIEGIIWLRDVVDKPGSKHHMEIDEVEEVLCNKPKFRFVEKGKRKGENVYLALRPLKNAPFRPISALHSDFNPRNTQCIPVVKILTRLDFERN